MYVSFFLFPSLKRKDGFSSPVALFLNGISDMCVKADEDSRANPRAVSRYGMKAPWVNLPRERVARANPRRGERGEERWELFLLEP